MARIFPMPPNEDLVFLDADVAFTVPSGPTVGVVWPLNRVIALFDNAGVAAGANKVITGAINGGTSFTLNAAYQRVTLRWTGAQWNT